MNRLLDQNSQQQVADATSTAAKAATAALGGQLIFGYSINEWAAIVGIIVTVAQFSYWIYEKFFKDKKEK